jgi:hypothetical protein
MGSEYISSVLYPSVPVALFFVFVVCGVMCGVVSVLS